MSIYLSEMKVLLSILGISKRNRIKEPKGFKLEFIFDQSPYFTNRVLTMTYHMIDEDEHILEKTIRTDNEWYPLKCMTR